MGFDILFILFSYLVGAIPSGYLLAKYIKGIDIRTVGSGNIGATNVNRILGKKLGALTLALDAGKSFAVVGLGMWWMFSPVILSLSAFSILLGNCFSVFLKGQGGKGVATTFGLFLALSPAVFFIGLSIYGMVYFLTHISAMGSLAASLFWPIGFYLLKPEYGLLACFISALVFVQHRKNIAEMCKKYDKNA